MDEMELYNTDVKRKEKEVRKIVSLMAASHIKTKTKPKLD